MLIICSRVKEFKVSCNCQLKVSHHWAKLIIAKRTWIVFFPSSHYLLVFNAQTLVTLTGLPTTESSVSEGRTSSLSSSVMSYKKYRNKDYLEFFFI